MRVSQPRVQFFPLAIVSIFIVLGIIGIARHEMWRDELQAWLIARDSVSLIDLFRNLRYEGHPGLWHLMIYACIKLKKEPFVMQLLHLAIASTSVFLIVRYSPFTNLQKTLISFGYFIFYEYSIISRNYAIAVLLIFLLCILYKKRFNQIFIYFIILGLLANTNIYGWMISISFTSALVLDFILTNFKSELQIKIRKLISFLPGFVFYLVAAAASLMLMLPPSDRGRGTEFLVQFDLKHVLETSSIVWTSYIPVPKKTFRFWETNFF